MSHPSRILFGLAAAALMTVATVAVATQRKCRWQDDTQQQ